MNTFLSALESIKLLKTEKKIEEQKAEYTHITDQNYLKNKH
jgi:hypothetical protein